MSEQSSWYWKPVEEAIQDIDRADSRRPRGRFVILGAGIAGLAAAWELSKRGHQVEVLEGSDRIGGRIFTHHFRNGSYAEKGAMRVPLAHDYTHHYIREAKIPASDLRRFWSSLGTGFLDIRGQIVREDEYRNLLPSFPGLTVDERRIVDKDGIGALLGWAMEPLFEAMEPKFPAFLEGDFSDPDVVDLDSISWEGYLAERTPLSEDGRALLGAALSLKAVWHWSMAAILRDEINQMHPQGKGYNGVLCEIDGGTDRLPHELADLLPLGTIRLRTKVLDIEAGARGGKLVIEDGEGARSELTFEHLLCTLPFPVMREMPLQTFSEPKRQAIQGLRYASSTKVLLNYDERWWERDLNLLGGRSVSDRPGGEVRIPRQMYYPSDSVPAPCGPDVAPAGVTLRGAGGKSLAGIFSVHVGEAPQGDALAATALNRADLAAKPGTLLAAYTLNDGARELCQAGDTCAEQVLKEVEAIHQSTAPRQELKEHLCWCWDKSPWAKGAFGITPPKDLTNHFQAAKKEQGTVYFAGEHVSIAPGWIQGSLESALREVARMLRNT